MSANAEITRIKKTLADIEKRVVALEETVNDTKTEFNKKYSELIESIKISSGAHVRAIAEQVRGEMQIEINKLQRELQLLKQNV